MKKVAVLDYGSGNIHSITNSLAAALQQLDQIGKVTAIKRAEDVAKADYLALPGVGSFSDCRKGLESADMVDACRRHALEKAKPFLGVCVGMQLLAGEGFEFAPDKGLNWIGGKVVALEGAPRLPHMGWNDVRFLRRHPLAEGLGEAPHFYFDHGFAFVCEKKSDVLATADYGGAFTAAVARDNVVGVQFHPEKSQRVGLAFLRNFVNWKP